MTKKSFQLIIVLIIFFLSPLYLFCANPKIKEPEWFQNYRILYPDDEYIVQRGKADKEENSKTEAVAQIARYFQTSVNANLRTSIQAISIGNKVSENTSVINDIDVMSQVDLFAVEFTDPYYNKKEKKWYCLAYINRDKAWIQYKPTVDIAKSEFYSMKKNAEDETDYFSKMTGYSKAWKSGKRFLEKLEFARILNPQKEEAYYLDRQTVGEIPALISQVQNKCSIYLLVKGDYGNIISTALVQTLSQNGFKVVISEGSANYIAIGYVENNVSGNDPISLYPSLELLLNSKSGKTVYSIQTKVENKTVSYTLENAQKKSFPILAEQSSNNITSDFSEILGY